MVEHISLFIQHLKCNLVDKPKIKSHDLFLSAFTELISEAVRELRDHVIVKENDMELFQYFCRLSINCTPQILLENFHDIKDLILNKKFITFYLVSTSFSTPLEFS
jgi:hypothetical protein